MKNINLKEIDKRYYLVGFLLLIIVGLFGFCIIYAYNHYNDEDKIEINNLNEMYTLASDQLDFLNQPSPNLKLKYEEFPETSDTLNNIDINLLKKIFQTKGKSIIVVEKNDCSYCQDFEPKIIEALNYYEI